MAKCVCPAYQSMCTKYRAMNVFYDIMNWELKTSAAIAEEAWEKAVHTSRGKELEIMAIKQQKKKPR